MSHTLLKESSVFISYKGKGYRFDALSSVSFSQTYNRSSNTRKTLHSKNAKTNTIVSSKSSASVNLGIVCTDTYIESIFFDLMGMNYIGHYKYQYQTSNNVLPNLCEIYIVTQYDVFKLAPAAIESIDLPLSIQSAGNMNVSFTCATMERVQEMPSTSGILVQGDPLIPTPVQFKYKNSVNNAITNAGINFRQEVTWREDRGLHDIGQIYYAKHPILTNTSITANVTTNLQNNHRYSSDPEVSSVELYQSSIYVLLQDVLITKRIDTGDVFTESYDIGLTEQADVFVEYGGLVT